MRKGIYKFNKITAIINLVVIILFVLVNIIIYKMGVDFGNEYNAASYKIERFQTREEIDPITFQTRTYLPGFFTYYDEDHDNIVAKNQLYEPYEKMNYVTSNLYENIKLICIFVFVLAVFGVTINAYSRVTYIGHVFSGILFYMLFMESGVLLNWSTLIFTSLLLISTYGIYKARFVDYDRSFIPFVKYFKHDANEA